MADITEQYVYTSFCMQLIYVATEVYEILKSVFGEEAVIYTRTF